MYYDLYYDRTKKDYCLYALAVSVQMGRIKSDDRLDIILQKLNEFYVNKVDNNHGCYYDLLLDIIFNREINLLTQSESV